MRFTVVSIYGRVEKLPQRDWKVIECLECLVSFNFGTEFVRMPGETCSGVLKTCVCTCMCLHVHVYPHVMCLHVCGGQKSTSVVFLCFHPSLFSEVGSFSDLGFRIQSDWLASALQMFSHLCLPSTRNTDICHRDSFLCTCRGSRLSSPCFNNKLLIHKPFPNPLKKDFLYGHFLVLLFWLRKPLCPHIRMEQRFSERDREREFSGPYGFHCYGLSQHSCLQQWLILAWKSVLSYLNSGCWPLEQR